MDEETRSRWAQSVGTRADWYARRFERIARAGIWGSSWNWPAFWASSAWFFYRRMPRLAVINLAAVAMMVATCVRGSPAHVGEVLAW